MRESVSDSSVALDIVVETNPNQLEVERSLFNTGKRDVLETYVARCRLMTHHTHKHTTKKSKKYGTNRSTCLRKCTLAYISTSNSVRTTTVLHKYHYTLYMKFRRDKVLTFLYKRNSDNSTQIAR
jgi:hypothetical protein